MTPWATPEQAKLHWADARTMDPAVLDTLLEVATEGCAAYAPVVAEPVPTSYMLACVYQAREVHAATNRDGDVIGFGDFAIRARELSTAVKALLRPTRAIGALG